MRKFLIYIIVMMIPVCCFSQASSYDEEYGLRMFRAKNYSSALSSLQKAAKEGSLAALDALGQMYQNGWGVEKNTTNMFNMYNRAIDKSYAPSFIHLAEYYVEKGDAAKSLELYKKAADLGSTEACMTLGNMLFISDSQDCVEWI